MPTTHRPIDATASSRATAPVPCDHCGLPVPRGLLVPDAAHQFCCNGCRAVYDIIHRCDLGRYYAIREKVNAGPRPARLTGAGFEHFDDPAALERHVRMSPEGFREARLQLENVHCAACVWLIERLPRVVDGVLESRLDFRRAIVTVRYRDAAPLSHIARTLDGLGYTPHPVRDAAGADIDLRAIEDRRFLVRLGVAGALAGNVMLFSFALYGGMFSGIEAQFEHFFRWSSCGLALIALTWPGRAFFVGALSSIRLRRLHMDLPIAIGLLVGGASGLVNTLRGTGEIYFDTITVLVFLLLVGRWLQHRQQRRAADAVALLFSLTPATARRVDGDTLREVPVEAVIRGDVVDVSAGGHVPVDGVIIRGTSDLDASLLTGESRPETITVGGRVAAGMTNLTAPLRVRTDATGEDTRIGRLMHLVEDATRRRAPIVRIADRLAGIFTGVVLAGAAATMILWLVLDADRAVDHTTALLIVTCPCALALATPLAIVAGVGQAAARAILIKGGDALEALAMKPGTLLLDKTGTITRGSSELVLWNGPDHLRAHVAAIESHCTHHVAHALARGFAGGTPLDVRDIEHHVGGGVSARIGNDHFDIGSPAFVARRAAVGPDVHAAVASAAARALTPVVIATNATAVAVAGIGDPIRDDARDALRDIAHMGWHIRIISGDHPDVVLAVGAQLGLDPADCLGGLTPEDKVAAVEEAARAGLVVMVGDGVNDAAALGAATVGISMQGGAEASLTAADITIMRPGLEPLAELLRGARRTLGVIRRNLVLSIGYNAACGALAVAGMINPLVAAILMPLSSITVVTSSYRARMFRRTQP